MLFDKVLSQTFNTVFGEQLQQHLPIIRQRLFSFSPLLGCLITGVDTDNLTLYDHNNLCGGESEVWVS